MSLHTYRIDVRYESNLIAGIKILTRLITSTSTTNGYDESPLFGGSGSQSDSFVVDSGDWINKIEVQNTGAIVGGFTFYTMNGKVSKKFGNTGGQTMTIVPPTDKYRLTGVFGKSGAQLDKVGFIFTWTDWQLKHKHQITKVVYPEI